MFNTLRLAARSWWRAKAEFGLAVVILALGVGANLTVLAIFNRVIWQAPPQVRDLDSLAVAQFHYGEENGLQPAVSEGATYPAFEFLDQAVSAPAQVACEASLTVPFGRGASSEQVEALLVSPGYFELLGVGPRLGQPFSHDEPDPRRVIFSYEFWKTRYGADPSVLGGTCWLANRPYQVAAVMPPGFRSLQLFPVDLWLPVEAVNDVSIGAPGWDALSSTSSLWLRVLVRAKASAPLAAAEEWLKATLRNADGMVLSDQPIEGAHLMPAREATAEGGWLGTVWAWGMVLSAFALLVACANVANLQVIRNLRRLREMAVRLQLGASKWHLLRQLLAESALVSLCAGGVATLLALWMLPVASRLAFDQALTLGEVFNWKVGVFLVVMLLATTMVTGLLPAASVMRFDWAGALKTGRNEVPRSLSKLRFALVAGQLALVSVLLVEAGLLLGSYRAVTHVELGFDARHTLAVGFPGLEKLEYSDVRLAALFDRVIEEARQLEGIAQVALASTAPFDVGWVTSCRFSDEPRRVRRRTQYLHAVSAGYFGTLGIPVRKGRGFEMGDNASAGPVMVVNRAMEKLLIPEGEIVGRCLFISNSQVCTQVVGVVENAAVNKFDDPRPQFYIPLEQASLYSWPIHPAVVLLRHRGDPEQLGRLMAALAAIPELPNIRIRPLYADVEPQFRRWEQGWKIFSLLGLLALLVALAGYYAQISHWHASRRFEFGIRAALGATGIDLARLSLKQGLGVSLGGVAAGLLGAILFSRFLQSLYYGVGSGQPVLFLAVGAGLIAVTSAVSLLLSWREARRCPTEQLRYE